jgi:hypothetical protein
MLHKRYEGKQKVRIGLKLFARRIVDNNAELGHDESAGQEESLDCTENAARHCRWTKDP